MNADYEISYRTISDEMFNSAQAKSTGANLEDLGIRITVKNNSTPGLVDILNDYTKPYFRTEFARVTAANGRSVTYMLKVYLLVHSQEGEIQGTISNASGFLEFQTVDPVPVDNVNVGDLTNNSAVSSTRALVGFKRGGDEVVNRSDITNVSEKVEEVVQLSRDTNNRITVLENYMPITDASNKVIDLADGKRMFEIKEYESNSATIIFSNPPTEGASYFTILLHSKPDVILTWPDSLMWENETAPEFEEDALYLINVLAIPGSVGIKDTTPVYIAKTSLVKTGMS